MSFWHFYAENAKQDKNYFKSGYPMTDDKNQLIYKIETKLAWEKAMADGTYKGAPIDLADGFIHFSTATQARVTAAKHFAGREGLIIAAVNTNTLGDAFKMGDITR